MKIPLEIAFLQKDLEFFDKFIEKGLLGNEGKSDGELPKVVHMPVELQRAMELNTKNASLPEGTYGLPLAGMIYFRYYANPKSLHSIELIYTGAAGKATVALQP